MRLFAIGAAFSAAAVAACAASPNTFETSVDLSAIDPIGVVEVKVAEDIIDRQLGSRRLVNEHSIGPEDAEDVAEILEKELIDALESVGAYRPQVGGPVSTLTATITAVTPTRLDFTERGRKEPAMVTGVARGGAQIEAVLTGYNSVEVERFEYSYYADSIADSGFTGDTWLHARRAFRGFATKLANTLAEHDRRPDELLSVAN